MVTPSYVASRPWKWWQVLGLVAAAVIFVCGLAILALVVLLFTAFANTGSNK